MPYTVHAFNLDLPLKMGSVNCYLIKTSGGFVLIDSGAKNERRELERRIIDAGCVTGTLKLIVLTHGDFDHTGNAAYLRGKFDTKIAMHPADAAMLSAGDMFAGRQQSNFFIRKLAPALFGFGRSERCQPDILLQDGDDLSAYGLDAEVVSLPGHSLGSIAVLTADGDLFCGDLLENIKGPAFNSIMDDGTAARTSLEILRIMNVNKVYPGHGEPFFLNDFPEQSGLH